jgi:CubicO group peptidase (beta-lactamase class C family)
MNDPMRALLSLACLTLLAHPVPAAGEPVLPGIGAAMREQVDAAEVAGVVTLVTTKDEIIHWEATGFTRLSPETPMPRDAVFLLASITKVFTGVAILMLQDEGLLRVTDPVAKYLPQFAGLRTISGEPAEIRIADLLTHMSGLQEIDRSSYAAVTSLAGLMEVHSPVDPPSSAPGAQFRYNTFAFDVAGRIVEVVSGRPYDEFLAERLFHPLGMKDTTFFPNEVHQRRLAGLYAKNRKTGVLEPRDTWGELPLPVRGRFPPMPGSSLFATAGDLARFCQLLLNRGVFDGKRYLSEEAYALLTSIQTRAQPAGVRGWGLGPYVTRSTEAGIARWLSVGSFGHSGATGCHLVVDPARGTGYVVLIHRTNLPGGFEHTVVQQFLESAVHALGESASAGLVQSAP